MKMISLIATALILFVSAPSFAQDWFEYQNRKDFFAISFPAQPNVKDMTYTTEYQNKLPARVYSYESGSNRYSVTVVDYTNLEQLEKERVKDCRAAGNEGDVCMDTYMHDMRGASVHAMWNLMQKAAKVTHFGYSRQDLVEGFELYLTNADASRTFAGAYMHENRLYILEGTVPAKAPPPALFYQSLGFLDKDGKRIRYRTPYSNGLSAPARTNN